MDLIHPLKIRERIQHYASLDEPTSFSRGTMGAIVGAFNTTLIGGDKSMYSAALHRRQVFGWLFSKDDIILGEFHSTVLSPMEWNALFRWMGASWKDGELRPGFRAELRWVYQWAEKAFKMVKDNPQITMAEIITICSHEEGLEVCDGYKSAS
jgi:hypothetical protein